MTHARSVARVQLTGSPAEQSAVLKLTYRCAVEAQALTSSTAAVTDVLGVAVVEQVLAMLRQEFVEKKREQ